MAGLVLSSSPLAAQQPDSLRRDTVRFRLQAVEVSVLRGPAADLRAPAALSVVPRSALQDAQLTAGLDEALAAVPGVVVNNRYNFALGSRIAVRGLGARAAFGVRGLRLMQDGIPLTMPDGQANLNNLDLGSAGRIEILRGPASSLYGNAAGGVISIETEPAPTGFVGELRTVAGDAGGDEFTLKRFTKHQVKVAGRRGQLDYLLSGSRLETDGFRAHSSAEQSVLNTRLGWSPTESTRWTLLLNLADAPTAQNPGSLPVDSARHEPGMAWPNNVRTGAGEAASQVQAGIAVQHGDQTSRLQASVYGLARSLDNPIPVAVIVLERQGAGARASYGRKLAMAGRELQLTVGADLEHQSDERTEFTNVNGARGAQRRDQTDRVTAAGPFAQVQLAVTPRAELTLGARYDVIRFEVEDRWLSGDRDDSGDRTLAAISPRLALLYSFSDAAAVYASIGTAFQTPTTTELINRPPSEGAPCCPGGLNPDLDPQRALNFELGIKGQLGERVRYEAAAYQMNVDDALVSFQVEQTENRDFFRNAGETRHRGFELAMSGVLTPWILLETAYTYSRFVFTDDGVTTSSFEGNRLPGVSPHHLFARVRVQPHPVVNIEVENEYTASFFADDANLASNPAANVVDVRVLFDLRRARLAIKPFLAVNNLFDRRYNGSVVINAVGARFFEPAPGRNLYLGAAVRFGDW